VSDQNNLLLPARFLTNTCILSSAIPSSNGLDGLMMEDVLLDGEKVDGEVGLRLRIYGNRRKLGDQDT
jgi:hypothetical protein